MNCNWQFKAPLIVSAVALIVIAGCAEEDGPDDGEADSNHMAQEWPCFGLDASNSRSTSTENKISPENVSTLEKVWETKDLKGVTSTPAVVDGEVYLGDWQGKAHSFDAGSGEEAWSTDLEAPGPVVQVQGSPCVQDGAVFLGDAAGFLYSLDQETGEINWSTRMDEHPQTDLYSSPVVVDGVVYIGVGAWETVVAKKDYDFRGSMAAVDAKTGEILWKTYLTDNDEKSGAGVSVWAPPVIDQENGLVFVGTGQALEEPSAPLGDSVIAFDIDSGEIVWNTQFTKVDVFNDPGANGADGPDADVGQALITYDSDDGQKLLGVGDKAGTYYSLDRETGKIVWQKQLTEPGTAGGVNSSGAFDGETIYINSIVGAEGSKWPIATSVLFALDKDDGTEKWVKHVPAPFFGALTHTNGVVFLGDSDGFLHAYDAQDGAELLNLEFEGGLGGGVAIHDGTVYVGWGFWLIFETENSHGGLVALEPTEDSAPDPTTTSAEPGTVEYKSAGGKLYTTHCATCHDIDGTGGLGPDLSKVADDLTSSEHQKIIQSGRGKMPGFKNRLSQKEIDLIVEFQRSGFED